MSAPAGSGDRRLARSMHGARWSLRRWRLLHPDLAFAFVYLFIPIAYTIAFSFNDAGCINLVGRVHAHNWLNPCGAPGMCSALGNSLEIGAARDARRDAARHAGGLRAGAPPVPRRGGTNLLIFLPMATPEIVIGASLLALFVDLAGRAARLLDDPDRAHHVLPVSFVVVTVRARLAGLDPTPRAGGAWISTRAERRRSGGSRSRWSFPGILGAALLAFSLSFDDFIITNLNSGNDTTFPMYVYVSDRAASPRRPT